MGHIERVVRCGRRLFFGVVTTLLFFLTFILAGCGNNRADSKESTAADGDIVDTVGHFNPIDYGSFTDSRDGRIYRTVVIGTQVWMAENLNYASEYSWCYHEDESNCQKYGRFYDWESALSACPAGWRLPTDNDWTILVRFASTDDINANSGMRLKATTGWVDDGRGFIPGTDDFGFSALPGGYWHYDFWSIGKISAWWSATEAGAISAIFRFILSPNSVPVVHRRSFKRNSGFSVRCLQD
ncbi:MAG: fibrobacter succinogenes major paralogous domain-containing protein [Chitinispirillales bacterium]|jgi:uncharacterized protein (TIGR02145 family)|nr:fibrobacter succinogenes major paralogous domain-containing protein [Chitinispirillales bacterium]